MDKPYNPGKYSLPKRLKLIDDENKIFFKIQTYRVIIDIDSRSNNQFPSHIIIGRFSVDEHRENFLKD
ncbi:MAG: hypothetical protein ACFFG0_35615 [Candidatus Thorarchaeota archaeon]